MRDKQWTCDKMPFLYILSPLTCVWPSALCPWPLRDRFCGRAVVSPQDLWSGQGPACADVRLWAGRGPPGERNDQTFISFLCPLIFVAAYLAHVYAQCQRAWRLLILIHTSRTSYYHHVDDALLTSSGHCIPCHDKFILMLWQAGFWGNGYAKSCGCMSFPFTNKLTGPWQFVTHCDSSYSSNNFWQNGMTRVAFWPCTDN